MKRISWLVLLRAPCSIKSSRIYSSMTRYESYWIFKNLSCSQVDNIKSSTEYGLPAAHVPWGVANESKVVIDEEQNQNTSAQWKSSEKLLFQNNSLLWIYYFCSLFLPIRWTKEVRISEFSLLWNHRFLSLLYFPRVFLKEHHSQFLHLPKSYLLF